MNPNSPSSIRTAVDSTVEAILDHGTRRTRSDPSRVNFLRISSFPFCARAWFLSQPHSRRPVREESTTSVFFTSVGTAVHTCLQGGADSLSVPVHLQDEHMDTRTLPNNALLVQDWICRECKHRHTFTPHPGHCAHCGCNTLKGDEHEVSFSRRVLGHMDGTFAFAPETSAVYDKSWVHIPFDYKTTTKSAIEGTKLPYPENVDQLLTYGALKQREGYNIPSVALIYVCRDNPFTRAVKVIKLDAKAQIKKVLRYEREYEAAAQVTTIEVAMALGARATSDFETNCMYCSYKKMCTDYEAGNHAYLKRQNEQVIQLMRTRKEHHWPTA